MKRPEYRYADDDGVEPARLREALATWGELLIRAAQSDKPVRRPASDGSKVIAVSGTPPSE